ncbi:MAG: hypothetical protein AAGI24_01665 [Pseudomonadota bacterium]
MQAEGPQQALKRRLYMAPAGTGTYAMEVTAQSLRTVVVVWGVAYENDEGVE